MRKWLAETQKTQNNQINLIGKYLKLAITASSDTYSSWIIRKHINQETCTDRKMLHPLPGKTTVSEMGFWPEPKVIQSECRGCRKAKAAFISKEQCWVSVSVYISAVSARVRRRDCKAPEMHNTTWAGFQHFHRIPSLSPWRWLSVLSV